MLQKLSPTDVVHFVDSIIFSDDSIDKMTIDCRSDIVNKVIKFCRMKCSKTKNDISLSQEWNDTVSTLTEYHRHLQRMEDETMRLLLESDDMNVGVYCRLFDKSKSSVDKLQDILTLIVIEGPDLPLLKNFLSCCPESIEWEPQDAYIKAISVLLERMRNPKKYHHFETASPPLCVLELVLEDITKEDDELMVESTAVDMLNDFCQDSSVSVSVRLGILQLLEKTNYLSAEYGDLLLLYRTQAIVSSVWPELEVSEEEVKDSSERQILFSNLISLSKDVAHFDSLAKLLSYWPPFPQEEPQNYNDEPWTKLLSGLVAIASKDALNSAICVLEKALSSSSFTTECCHQVFAKVKDQGSLLHILKYALKTDYEDLQIEALTVLKERRVTSEDYDDALLDLLLRHNLTAQIISTGLYKPVIEYLLHSQDDILVESYRSIDTVVKELYEAGHQNEAGSLLHIKYATHTGLSTYSSAMHVLQRWLSAPKS